MHLRACPRRFVRLFEVFFGPPEPPPLDPLLPAAPLIPSPVYGPAVCALHV